MATTNTGHDWREAGDAWGHSAADWACLFEHICFEAVLAVFSRTGIGPGARVLDVACGSGMAMRLAHGCGAVVSGIDAAEALVDIARVRTPDADVRLGSMFELPWPDESFDVAVSFNGIWGHCGAAVAEMRRVVRPGGMVGITFWGFGPPNDLRPVFQVIAAHSPDDNVDGMRETNLIAKPGVAEAMLEAAGLDVVERGARVAVLEWPDDDLAWRAMASIGPIAPALANSDHEVLRRDVLAAMAPCRDRDGIYRYRNDQQFVIARRP
jgi:SAM-dependent methyltransferase